MSILSIWTIYYIICICVYLLKSTGIGASYSYLSLLFCLPYELLLVDEDGQGGLDADLRINEDDNDAAPPTLIACMLRKFMSLGRCRSRY